MIGQSSMTDGLLLRHPLFAPALLCGLGVIILALAGESLAYAPPDKIVPVSEWRLAGYWERTVNIHISEPTGFWAGGSGQAGPTDIAPTVTSTTPTPAHSQSTGVAITNDVELKISWTGSPMNAIMWSNYTLYTSQTIVWRFHPTLGADLDKVKTDTHDILVQETVSASGKAEAIGSRPPNSPTASSNARSTIYRYSSDEAFAAAGAPIYNGGLTDDDVVGPVSRTRTSKLDLRVSDSINHAAIANAELIVGLSAPAAAGASATATATASFSAATPSMSDAGTASDPSYSWVDYPETGTISLWYQWYPGYPGDEE